MSSSNVPPPRNRRYESDSDSEDDPRSRPSRRPTRRGPPEDGPRPILVDPTSPRRRSDSRARFQSSSDDSDNRKRATRKGGRPRDLERKDSQEHQQFRDKRDGYLSDEGETLKKSRVPTVGLQVPRDMRGQRSNSEAPPPYDDRDRGDRDRGGRRTRDYDTDPDEGRRGYGDPRRQRYGGYEYGDDNSRRPRDRGDRGDRADRGDRGDRETRRRDRDGGYPPDVDRGYRSDHAPRRRDDDYRARPSYDDDKYDRRRRDEGYKSDGPRSGRRDYYSDRDDRNRRDQDRDRYASRYDDDRRYRSGRDGRSSRSDPRRRGGGSGSRNWQKEAGELFVTYALPIIQKEGTKFVKKQAQTFLSKRGGGSGGGLF